MSHRPKHEPHHQASSPTQIPLGATLVIGGFILVFVIELLSILVLNDGKFTQNKGLV